MDTKKIGLYVHWPFCKARCRYCGFFTLAGKDKLLPKYTEALIREFESYHEQLRECQVNSIYLGGGTPSLADPELIAMFLRKCQQRLELANDTEVTIEANPESVSEEKLNIYLEAGINRLSMGLQAWQDMWLHKMGRLHDHREFVEKYNLARKCGFTNIGVDLIFGMPGQALTEWQESLEQVIKLNPEHVSCYSLELDKNSFWGREYQQGKLKAADERVDRQMYHLARRLLKQAGYLQYEISNWCRPKMDCRHNLMFWKGYEYIGLGAGAHSYFGGKRWQNAEDIEGYCEKMKVGNRVKVQVVSEDRDDQMEEFVMLRLRLVEGLDLDEYQKKFGVSLQDECKKSIGELERLKLVRIRGGRLKLTKKGLDVVDTVTKELLLMC